jgi:hypothetical protein
MAEMIYANDLKQAMKDAGMLDYVKAEVVYKSAWGVPIVDAEEVVRCKDCKWYSQFISMTGKLLSEGRCEYHSNYFAEDDFCSRGERKNG